MQWGTGVADDLGVEVGRAKGSGNVKALTCSLQAVVEASVYGRRLYEKFGFVMEQHVTMEPPPRWATNDPKQKQRFFWMRRPVMPGSDGQ